MTAATEHMQTRRNERGRRLRPELLEHKRKLDAWVERRKAAAAAARAEVTASG